MLLILKMQTTRKTVKNLEFEKAAKNLLNLKYSLFTASTIVEESASLPPVKTNPYYLRSSCLLPHFLSAGLKNDPNLAYLRDS